MAQKTISFRFTKNGVLTNVTSVVLSNDGATYGVKRNDTDGVVVAAATAMTHDGTGLYSYTFAEPAAALTYTAWIQWVYGGETRRVQRTLVGSPLASAMTLTDVRARVRYAAKNAGDTTSTTDVEIDYAVQDCLDDFTLATQLTRTTTAADPLEADDYAYDLDLAGDFAGFAPFRLLGARLDGDAGPYEPLDVIPYAELVERRRCNATTGRPLAIAFKSGYQFELYPTPGDAETYTPQIEWWRPGSNFTAGTGSPGSVTFNLPDDVLRVLCRHGIPAFLQGNMPEYKYTAVYRQEYEAFKSRMKGVAGLGEKSMTRGAAW